MQFSETELLLSPISVWEALFLAERGRVVLDPDPRRWHRKAMPITPVTEAPLTIEVAIASRTVDSSTRILLSLSPPPGCTA